MVQQTRLGVLHDLELNSIASFIRKLHMFLADEDPRFFTMDFTDLCGLGRRSWLLTTYSSSFGELPLVIPCPLVINIAII